MNQQYISGFGILFSETSDKNTINEDNTAPRIVKNIERVSRRFREYVDSEINEEIVNQTEQQEKVKELRKKQRTSK